MLTIMLKYIIKLRRGTKLTHKIYILRLILVLWMVYTCNNIVSTATKFVGRRAKENSRIWHLMHTEGSFGFRQIRVVESIFRQHKSALVIIYTNKRFIEDLRRKMQIFNDNGYRVQIRFLSLKAALKKVSSLPDAPIQLKQRLKFFDVKKVQTSQYSYSHVTDLFRILIIYIHGGIYIDTDVLVLKSFDNLRNTLGWEKDAKNLNGAVMIFDRRNEFVKECILEFINGYDPNVWGANGPFLLTKVFKKKFNNHFRNTAVVPVMQDAFYPFHWDVEIEEKCFELDIDNPKVKEISAKISKHSFAVHLNNHVTSHKTINPQTYCEYLFNSVCMFCSKR